MIASTPMRYVLALLLAFGLTSAAVAQDRPAQEPADTLDGQPAPHVMRGPPNIVFILADDLGWADLGAYGNPYIETPHLDRLAAEGVRFTDAYAASPVCSPTRASLQTGFYPARLGMNAIANPHRRPWARLLPPPNRWSLPDTVATIAEALAPAGYASAIIGKWNLGYEAPDLAGDRGYVQAPGDAEGLHPAYREAVARFAEANPHKGTGPITLQSIRFIEEQREGPFFCFVSFFAPHIKSEARDELVRKYERKKEAQKTLILPRYAAMVEAMDEGVGLILGALDSLGLAENTLVAFTSDNGGLVQVYHRAGPLVTTNAPLRGEKGTLYEGGLRVPLILRGPGVAGGGRTSTVPAISNDLFPTFLEAAGLPGRPSDGASLVPLLQDKNTSPRALYWHYPFYHHATPAAAIREGDLKLIEWYEDGRLELYDLGQDLGERDNLAEQRPEKAAALRKKLRAWQADVQAAMPMANPDYDPSLAYLWGRRPEKPWMPAPEGTLDVGAECVKLFDLACAP